MGGILGSSPSMDTSRGDTYRSVLNHIGGSYGDMFNQANGEYGADNAQARRADTAYSQYLQADPATQPYNAQQVAGAERGASEGAVRAQSALDANLAQRGVGGAGSSAATGGAAAIQAALAANNTNVQNAVAQRNIDRRDANLATNANFLNGVAGQDYGRATGALGSQADINSGLMQSADQLAMDKYNQEVARQNADTAFWGQLAGAGVTAWGGPSHKAAAA